MNKNILTIILTLILTLTPLFSIGLPFKNIFHKTPTEKLQISLKKARKDKAWPGAVIISGSMDSIYFFQSEGYYTYEKKIDVSKNTIFDLASITKVIATTSALMKLCDDKRINLDLPVQNYIPEFDGPDSFSVENKKNITVRHLITHSAGLPPFRPFWKYPEASRLDSVFQSPLNYEPGTHYKYSDIGLIICGKIIEKITGETLATYCKNTIFNPLNMIDSEFNPAKDKFSRIMPTEYSDIEKDFVQGHVHDENAHSLGGVAGHAGLFSTADDLAKYCRMILQNGVNNDGKIIFSKTMIDSFSQKANIIKGSSRCLGWDSPSGNASGGVYLSNHSIGHTGFTGTSLWIDLENNLYIILLTNAVHPNRSYKSPNYYDWRQKIHSIVYELLGYGKKNPDLSWRKRWQ